MKFKRFLFLMFVSLLPLSSCSVKSETKVSSYLNYCFKLTKVGDIHNADIYYPYPQDRVKGYKDYKYLFNLNDSFMNFQCKGDTFDNFHCETSFSLKTTSGVDLFSELPPTFDTELNSAGDSKLIFKDPEIGIKVGTVFVSTIYYCRYQKEYDVNGDGNMVLLTFEFWKTTFNDVPEIKPL